MKNLLKKLIVDLPTLEEYTTVALKMLTSWYERCFKYYGHSTIAGMMTASEEEKRLTMNLFTRIFDALAKRAYDPELFSKALPCLSAIGCALSPDYSYTISSSNSLSENEFAEAGNNHQLYRSGGYRSASFDPIPLNTINIALSPDFEEIIKKGV